MTEESMQDCIRLCWECRHECQDMLFSHCLEQGGPHTAADHVKIMADCIQICQTAADFMTRGSALHQSVCAACADICEACAESCEEIEGMESCAAACRRCAESCRAMGGAGLWASSQKGETHGIATL